jgi:hypothetical protein
MVTSEVLTAAIMKMLIFWALAASTRAMALMIEAESTTETPVSFYQTTRCNNPSSTDRWSARIREVSKVNTLNR